MNQSMALLSGAPGSVHRSFGLSSNSKLTNCDSSVDDLVIGGKDVD